jgi:hypothetical protein
MIDRPQRAPARNSRRTRMCVAGAEKLPEDVDTLKEILNAKSPYTVKKNPWDA